MEGAGGIEGGATHGQPSYSWETWSARPLCEKNMEVETNQAGQNTVDLSVRSRCGEESCF